VQLGEVRHSPSGPLHQRHLKAILQFKSGRLGKLLEGLDLTRLQAPLQDQRLPVLACASDEPKTLLLLTLHLKDLLKWPLLAEEPFFSSFFFLKYVNALMSSSFSQKDENGSCRPYCDAAD
jgi:hypothetical protein